MCTAILLKNNNLSLFGRNMDIEYSFNEQIIITPTNYPITFKNKEAIINHYAILGMGTVIDNYPLYADCVNEHGLAVTALAFSNAKYKTIKTNKINIAPYELPLYILSKFKNVDEAINHLKNINLININFNKTTINTPLHFMISDKDKSIVIEQTDKLYIYDNPYNVLTNSPSFSYHIENIKNYLNLSIKNIENDPFNLKIKPNTNNHNLIGLPGDYTSQSRFIKTLFIKNNIKLTNNYNDTLYHFFEILNQVKMLKGIVLTNKGYEYTRYTSCMDLNNIIYYYKTYNSNNINKITLKDYNINSNELILPFNLS